MLVVVEQAPRKAFGHGAGRMNFPKASPGGLALSAN